MTVLNKINITYSYMSGKFLNLGLIPINQSSTLRKKSNLKNRHTKSSNDYSSLRFYKQALFNSIIDILFGILSLFYRLGVTN